MDREELRFRLRCEARKAPAACATRSGPRRDGSQRARRHPSARGERPPRCPMRGDAARRGDLPVGASRCSAVHFCSRPRRGRSRRRRSRSAGSAEIRQRFPDVSADAASHADRIVDGRSRSARVSRRRARQSAGLAPRPDPRAPGAASRTGRPCRISTRRRAITRSSGRLNRHQHCLDARVARTG